MRRLWIPWKEEAQPWLVLYPLLLGGNNMHKTPLQKNFVSKQGGEGLAQESWKVCGVGYKHQVLLSGKTQHCNKGLWGHPTFMHTTSDWPKIGKKLQFPIFLVDSRCDHTQNLWSSWNLFLSHNISFLCHWSCNQYKALYSFKFLYTNPEYRTRRAGVVLSQCTTINGTWNWTTRL